MLDHALLNILLDVQYDKCWYNNFTYLSIIGSRSVNHRTYLVTCETYKHIWYKIRFFENVFETFDFHKQNENLDIDDDKAYVHEQTVQNLAA